MKQWLESLARDLRYAVPIVRPRPRDQHRRRHHARARHRRQRGHLHPAERDLAAAAALSRRRATRHARRLVRACKASTGSRQPCPSSSTFAPGTRSFESMAFLDHRDLQLTGGQEPVRVFGARVTASFFPLLGAGPALGRVFTDLDNREGHEQVAILSHGLWRRAFASRSGGDRTRRCTIDQRPHQVVGVAPASFAFDHPAIGIREPVDVYVPFLMNDYYTLRSGSHSHLRRVIALARLRPGVDVRQANAEMAVLGARLENEHPDLYRRKPSGEDMGFIDAGPRAAGRRLRRDARRAAAPLRLRRHGAADRLRQRRAVPARAVAAAAG